MVWASMHDISTPLGHWDLVRHEVCEVCEV